MKEEKRPSTDRKAPSVSRQTVRKCFDNTWLPEYLALAISLGSTFTIIGILAAYDGQNIAYWHFPYSISLNAVVSTFSTIAKGFLAIAISAALGQWKWIWFRRNERRLKEFDVIDSASRGPWGSFRLLVTAPQSLPLILGALITILSLGVDPFVQQIISFRVEPSIDRASQSTVPFAQRYSKGMVHVSSYRVPGQTLVDDILTIDYPMIAAISQGLSQDVDTLQKQVPFTCTSGNCTWPSYTSLSVCSACNDVTSLLQKTEMNSKWPQWKNFLNITNDTLINGWTTALPATKYNLSDGNELWNANNVHELFAVAMTAHATFGPPETVSFQEDDLLFFAMSVIHANLTTSIGSTLSSWPESPVSATECALSFCVKQFNSSVQNGEFSEKVTVLQSVRSNNSWLASSSDSIKSNATDPSFDGPDSSLQVPIRTDLQLILSENQTQRFNVSQESIDGLAPYFNSLFDPSNNAVLLSNQSNMTAEDIGSRTTTNVNPLSSYMKLFWDSPNVTALFDNIATAMTNEMRRSDDNRTVMYGDTVVNETLIHVDWRWAILPIALGLLGCLFLSISIWETRRTQTAIWKESSLAILYHGIDRQLLQLSNGLTVYEMQKAAEQCRAQLLEIGDRLKLASPSGAYEPLVP